MSQGSNMRCKPEGWADRCHKVFPPVDAGVDIGYDELVASGSGESVSYGIANTCKSV